MFMGSSDNPILEAIPLLPGVEDAAWHAQGGGPLYRNLIHPRRLVEVAARQPCKEMWRLFQSLADPNFLERLPFEFHQRWFEIYLGAGLVSAGLDVSAPTPGRGPDFEIRADGRRVYVEAVCATAGDPLHEDAVAEPSTSVMWYSSMLSRTIAL